MSGEIGAKETSRSSHAERSVEFIKNLVTTAPPTQGTAASARGSAIRVGRPRRADRRHRILFFPPTQHLQNRKGARGAIRNEREREQRSVHIAYGNAQGVTCPSTGV